MLRRWLLLIWIVCAGITARAQENGSVSGVVVSTWDATPLSGVAVTVRGTTLATQADANGRYELKNVPPGNQVLRFSKSGYGSAVVTDVRVLSGQTTTVNGNLRPEFYEMEEYEVTAGEFTEQTEKILIERQKASSLTDAIGAEQFSRLGAGDAAEALGKVSGASIADGKFAVIRGLADRYTSTTFNGTDIPSADPDRKAAQLDLFPAKFINRIDVSKTFTPDMSGGFAGGSINIVSRDFPETFVFSFEAGTAFNSQSSLRKDFLMTDHGSTDWLAMDDGKRELPPIAAAANPRGTVPLNPAIKSSFHSRQFGPVMGDSPLNSNYALTFGDSVKLFGHRLGYLAGLNYKSEYNSYSDGLVAKYETRNGAPFTKVFKTDSKSVIEYTWAALTSLGYELTEDHTLGFNFMFVQTAEDEARRLKGKNEEVNDPNDPNDRTFLEQDILHWTERNLTYFQLRGSHHFPQLNGVQFDWAGALSTTSQSEPDQRFFQFLGDPDNSSFQPEGPDQPSKPTRVWRDVEENNTSVRSDLTIPLPSYNSRDNSIKMGPAFSMSERTYKSRAFEVRSSGNHPFWSSGDPNDYLAPENEPFTTYQNFANNFQYEGQINVSAGYLMADWSVLEWLRLVGGARYEHTDISVITTNTTKGESFSTKLIQDDILPSLGMTIYLRTNLLLRAAWSQTVVRPTYREVSRAEIYDIARGRTYLGNQSLQMSAAQNYDLRIEWYPHPGELLAFSAFMKDIAKPIELHGVDTENKKVEYYNSPEAKVRGLEAELRENLGNLWKPLEQYTIGFNAAYIQSEVPVRPDELRNRSVWSSSQTRTMYDQPAYILNGDISWENARSGTTVTLSGGVVGPRLTLVGVQFPDEIEQPTPQLDVFISQKIGKHWKVKLSAKNLLNPAYETTVTYPGFTSVIESYTKGMTFGLSVNCEF